MTETLNFINYLRGMDIKLYLENEHLKIDAPQGTIKPPLYTEIAGRKEELIAFLRPLYNRNVKAETPVLKSVARDVRLPLSYSQQRMWLMDRLEVNKGALNALVAVRLSGLLDIKALKASINEIVKRHEILRTVIREENDQIYQVVMNEADVPLPVEDLQELGPAESRVRAEKLCAEEVAKPFDAVNDILVRARLLREGEEKYILLLTMHHLVSDDWSLNVFIDELNALYESFVSGRVCAISQLPIQYADYAVWQKEWIKSEEARSETAYWKKCLSGIDLLKEFPTDHSALSVQDKPLRDRYRRIIPTSLVQKLKTVSQQEKSTLFMLLIAVFNILLYQYTAQTSLAVISAVNGRSRRELERLIGFFVNTIILHCKVHENLSFRQFLAQVRQTISEAYLHQTLPFEEAMKALDQKESARQFKIFFNMLSSVSQMQEFKLPGLTCEPVLETLVRSPEIGGGFDLTFIAIEDRKTIQLDISYNVNLFNKSTIEWLTEHYLTLLTSIGTDAKQCLRSLPSLACAPHRCLEPAAAFERFSKEETEQSLVERFEKQVNSYPQRIAVTTEERTLTYTTLNEEANRLAYTILQEYDDRFKLSKREKIRYARQLLLGGWGSTAQEKIKSTKVFVAGSGGASALLVQLALSGFGTLVNCDFDAVELSNLNRQFLHNESRIGMNKALSSKKTLDEHGFNPYVKVIAHPVRVTRDNVYDLVGDAAIIFDVVDDPESKFILSECAVAKGIPQILSSMIDMSSYAVILSPPKTPCFHCLYDKNKLKEIYDLRKLGKKAPQPVVAPSMSLSCGFAVNEALKIVTGVGDVAYNKYFFFNQRGHDLANTPGHQIITFPFSEHFRRLCREQGFDWDNGWSGRFIEEITLTRDPDCPVCGEKAQKAGRARFSIAIPDPVVSEKNDSTMSGQAVTELNQTVALLLGHDTGMLIGILGALKAAKIFTVLDVNHPESRLATILDDSEARLIITNHKYFQLASKLRESVNKNIGVINIDALDANLPVKNPGVYPKPEQLAYIVYTSGSTGQPKGVTQNHRNVLHFIMNYVNGLHIGSQDRLSLIPTFSFSAAMMDTFAGLLTGAALYPYNIREQGVANLGKWLSKNSITVYHSVPTIFRNLATSLAENEVISSLRIIDFGGEPVSRLDVDMVQKHFSSDCILVNGLGATELNVIRQFYIDRKTMLTSINVPVGYPVEDTDILILDESGERTGFNTMGEIVIKSRYLSPGYWQDPEQTAKAFKRIADNSDEHLFFTGDVGCIRPDGCLEHWGRKDYQVKIRGVRIELAEIEVCLLEHPQIREAVVTGWNKEDGNKELIAYLVLSDDAKGVTANSLRAYLAEKLPSALIPAVFLFLDALPLTSSGKVNRRALPLPDSQDIQFNPKSEYQSPQTDLEQRLAHIWQEVLKIDRLGVRDNFFDIGGNSLSTLTVISKAKEKGILLTVQQCMQYPTIAEQAAIARIYKEQPRQQVTTGVLPTSPNALLRFVYSPPGPWWKLRMRMDLPAHLNAEFLEQVVYSLIEHHEGLRLRLMPDVKHRLGYTQYIRPLSEAGEIFVYRDLSALADKEQETLIETAITKEWEYLRIDAGPVIRFVYFKRRADQPGTLLLFAHHFAVDLIALEILRQDFLRACQQVLQGEKIHLPARSASIREWAEKMKEYALSAAGESELKYWQTLPLARVARLPEDFPKGKVTRESKSANITGTLTAEETRDLLSVLPGVYNAGLMDILLAALLITCRQWSGVKALLLTVVDNARTHTLYNLDLSRTVADIASAHREFLEIETEDNIDVLQKIKEQRSLIPNHGNTAMWVYAYCGQLTDSGLRHEDFRNMQFNFQGQWDTARLDNPGNSYPLDIKIKPITKIDGNEEQADTGWQFNIVCSIRGEKFQTCWSYYQEHYKSTTVELLVRNYLTVLSSYINALPDRKSCNQT